MKIRLVTPGRFHTFFLARELLSRGRDLEVVTGFPWWKVKREGLPRAIVKTSPWNQLARFGAAKLGFMSGRFEQGRLYGVLEEVDRLAAVELKDCTTLIALSGSGLTSGQLAKQRNGKYICDRGSSHILFQRNILCEEAQRVGLPQPFFDQRVIDKELAEYEAADIITVPSNFVLKSFLEFGVAPSKLRKVSYGADIGRFKPTGTPADDRFDILFVGALSVRKGLHYLLEAYEKFRHPRKSLTLAGSATADTAHLKTAIGRSGAKVLGHVPHGQLSELMARSHVMVLPSIEEGLALVMGEAMAAGCPIIASAHTGADDLFDDGVEGFVVPARCVDSIVEKLETLAADRVLRKQMSNAAVRRAKKIGGWADYGDKMNAVLCEMSSEG